MKCTANKSDKTPCRANAVTGARVCHFHGGQLPALREQGILLKAEMAIPEAAVSAGVVEQCEVDGCLEKCKIGASRCTTHGGATMGEGGFREYMHIASVLVQANGKLLGDISHIIETERATLNAESLARNAKVLDRWESTTRNVARILQVVMPLLPPDEDHPDPATEISDLLESLEEARTRLDLL